MRLLIMGPPGAGKGTQAVLLRDYYNIEHISTGDAFREAMAKNTKLGEIARKHIDHGQLVPDSTTIDLVREKLSALDSNKGFLLDGFPRTIVQAEALDKILEELNTKLDAVINIDCDYDKLVKRIAGRRVCSNCKAGYHIENIKPKVDGICDVCGGKLIARKDDEKETVLERLAVYEKQTKPLLEYYNNQNLVITVNGDGHFTDLFENLKKILGGLK